MALGDVGGPVTELILTCRTPSMGIVKIDKGDAVRLVGDYTVDNISEGGDTIFGQALADASDNDETVPVKVRGVARFRYLGANYKVDGKVCAVMADSHGYVWMGHFLTTHCRVLKVNTKMLEVDVLL